MKLGLLKFKFPTVKQSIDVNRFYSKTLESARKAGCMESEMMSFYLKKYEIFTVAMETELVDQEAMPIFQYPPLPAFKDKKEEQLYLENSILEVITGERILKPSELVQRQEIPKEKFRHIELSKIKNQYMKLTAQGQAEAARINRLTFHCVLDAETDKPLWSSWQDFLNEEERTITLLISIKLMEFLGGLSTTLMRRVARNGMWRTKWISATKTGATIFKGEISEWDTNKSFLCYWSNFYDNMYNASETIEDHILENDSMLDSYLEAKNRERRLGSSGPVSDPNSDGIRAIFNGTHVNPIKKK